MAHESNTIILHYRAISSTKPVQNRKPQGAGITDDALNRQIYGDSGLDELNDALAMLSDIANMKF